MYIFILIACVGLVAISGSITLARRRGRSRPGLRFPGPRQSPLIGRVHDLPKRSMWLKLKEWADVHGPIYETSMMGTRFIVVSSEAIAEELLIKKGNHFGGRMQIRALIEHKAGPVYVALQDRNETWRTQRKWVHAAYAAAHQDRYHGVVERELSRFMMKLLVDPGAYCASTRELTGRTMASLAWDDAPLGERYAREAVATLTRMSICGPVVNTVPPLWHMADFLGCNPWRRHEEAREGRLTAWWTDTLRVAKQRFLDGSLPRHTWSYRYCEQLAGSGGADMKRSKLAQSPEDERFAACMLGFQCMVGVMTVAGPLQYFLMCMALHPEWLARVQHEIDGVCGDALPTSDDYARLPTVRACIKETLRWRSTVPLGVPHRCETPTTYRGVSIEKDTVILACEWALNRDVTRFPDPERYRPERWLEPGWPTYMEPLTQYPNLREGHAMHTFGWGRRACLGQAMTDYEMFIFAARVCWAFDLSLKKCPLSGEDVIFDTQATNSLVIAEPMPWPMDVKPRREERARAIVEQYMAVWGELRV